MRQQDAFLSRLLLQQKELFKEQLKEKDRELLDERNFNKHLIARRAVYWQQVQDLTAELKRRDAWKVKRQEEEAQKKEEEAQNKKAA